MASDWYDEMEKAEQEYDERECELAQEYSRGYEQGRTDMFKEFYNRLLYNKNEINNSNYPWNYIYLVARDMTKS